jgi:hypothetical protein
LLVGAGIGEPVSTLDTNCPVVASTTKTLPGRADAI